MSQVSQMTTFSVLSVNTECGQFDDWIYRSQPALSRVSMSMENHDPMKRRERLSIRDICENLRSNNVNSQAAAIRELEPVAKARQLEHTYGKEDLKQIIQALIEVLVPKANETDNVIRKTCEILQHALMLPAKQSRSTDKIFHELNQTLLTKSTSIYEIVIQRAVKLDTVYESSAMVLLTHLCCKTYLMKRIFVMGNTPEVLRLHHIVTNFLIYNLKRPETKPKNKGFSVSIIKNLSIRNNSIRLRMASKELDVIRIFYDIMRNEYSDEDLLWPTMQALTAFCSDMAIGNIFVGYGGFEVLCGLLSHGSTRLLYELLGCMKKLADLPAIQSRQKEGQMKEAIHNIIMLVGSDDAIIVERATATLRNIGFHDKTNKVHMVQNGVTSHVLAVLRTSSRFTCQPIPNMGMTTQQIIPSIYENCLSILNNVTVMGNGNINESAVHACHLIAANPDAADILLHYFNVGTHKYRKLAVTVIKKVIEAEPKFAEPFVDLRGTSNEPLPILLLKRAYESLDQWLKAAAELVNEKYAADSPQRKEAYERRKDHEEIVKRSMGLLGNLTRQANPRFFEILRDVLTEPRNGANPLLWLQRYRNEMPDSIMNEWLSFIASICETEWSTQHNLLCWFVQQANLPQSYFDELECQRPTLKGLIQKVSNLFKQQSQRQQQQHQMFMAQQQQQQQQYHM